MTRGEIAPSLAEQIATACCQLLKEAVRIAADHFGSAELPMSRFRMDVMEPSGPGRYTGTQLIRTQTDWFLIRDRLKSLVTGTEPWIVANAALEQYVDANGIRASGIWPLDVEDECLWPMFRIYVGAVGAFLYDHRRARDVIASMVSHLDSPQIEILGIIALEGLSAECPFRLGPRLSVRPIAERDLLLLGHSDLPPGLEPRLRWPTLVPHTDWWVCEARTSNPRGTAAGWNETAEIVDTLALALRAFKSGGMRIGRALAMPSSPFAIDQRQRAGMLRPTSLGETTYVLSRSEIGKFVAFWRQFCEFMTETHHYLQPPLRRLGTAGARANKEDALVDYVIGMEALLGTVRERTELSYRFRVRGSVILANRRQDRKAHLKTLGELYDLRSRIVHGQTPSSDRLEKALPVAEDALRRIWRWYFTHWRGESSNDAALAKVDEDLVC